MAADHYAGSRSGADTLRRLALCLEGVVPDGTDWDRLLAVANCTLLTPAVWGAIAARGNAALLPAEVRNFLAHIHDRNGARNRCLYGQLREAVDAFNRAGIRPILTKGAALLAAAGGETMPPQVMRDIDVTIETTEVEAAEACLARLGYRRLKAFGWGRESDVGAIDLHYPPGRYPAYWPSPAIRARHSRTVEFADGAVATVCSPTLSAQHLVVHDMIKDGDLWRLGIDFRSLHALHLLRSSDDGIDWDELHALFPDRLGKRALAAHLLSFNRFFSDPVPILGPVPRWSRLHDRLCRCDGWPVLGGATAMLGHVAWLVRQAQVKWRYRRPQSWRRLLPITRAAPPAAAAGSD